ncbi:hypothetical protein WJX79_001651 [Trebouxia sp. C0005]
MEHTVGPSFQDVTSFLKTNTAALTEDKALFQQSLAAFIRCNENPSTSPNFKSKVPDLPGPLLQLLQHAAAKTDQTLVLLLLKVLKILSRRKDNRTQIGKQGIQTANAAGAIQSICFQEQGRRAVGEADAVAPLITLLDSAHAKVRSRAVGALHNLSSDSTSIRTIRRSGGIPKLVALLRSSDCAICGSAAGALQNVSREVASRMIIREMDTVCPLADLLSSSDLQAQVCAAVRPIWYRLVRPTRRRGGKANKCPASQTPAVSVEREGPRTRGTARMSLIKHSCETFYRQPLLHPLSSL